MWTIFFGIVIGWCMLDVIVVEAVWNRLFVEGVKEFVMKASQQEGGQIIVVVYFWLVMCP